MTEEIDTMKKDEQSVLTQEEQEARRRREFELLKDRLTKSS